MDCEIAFVFAVGSSEDEAEEAVADAGKVVVAYSMPLAGMADE